LDAFAIVVGIKRPMRIFYSIFSDDLPTSRKWYFSLFGFQSTFDSDWFVHLQSPNSALLELGILSRNHEIVPVSYRGDPMGGMLTIVVEDVDAVFDVAEAAADVDVVEGPKNLFYGQRRMLLRDPNGLLVDVSSECPPDPKWLASITR